MVEIRRKHVEAFETGDRENPSQLLFRRAFVIDAEGKRIEPKEVIEQNEEEERGNEGFRKRLECWECSEDVLSIEIVKTLSGNFYRLLYLPARISIVQLLAMDDILREHDIDLSDKDYFFNSLRSIESLVLSGNYEYQEEDENWPLYDEALEE